MVTQMTLHPFFTIKSTLIVNKCRYWGFLLFFFVGVTSVEDELVLVQSLYYTLSITHSVVVWVYNNNAPVGSCNVLQRMQIWIILKFAVKYFLYFIWLSFGGEIVGWLIIIEIVMIHLSQGDLSCFQKWLWSWSKVAAWLRLGPPCSLPCKRSQEGMCLGNVRGFYLF